MFINFYFCHSLKIGINMLMSIKHGKRKTNFQKDGGAPGNYICIHFSTFQKGQYYFTDKQIREMHLLKTIFLY